MSLEACSAARPQPLLGGIRQRRLSTTSARRTADGRQPRAHASLHGSLGLCGAYADHAGLPRWLAQVGGVNAPSARSTCGDRDGFRRGEPLRTRRTRSLFGRRSRHPIPAVCRIAPAALRAAVPSCFIFFVKRKSRVAAGGRSVAASSQNRPIFPAQTGHARELGDVGGNERGSPAPGLGGDQQVIRDQSASLRVRGRRECRPPLPRRTVQN